MDTEAQWRDLAALINSQLSSLGIVKPESGYLAPEHIQVVNFDDTDPTHQDVVF